jgi:hypothetical protein
MGQKLSFIDKGLDRDALRRGTLMANRRRAHTLYPDRGHNHILRDRNETIEDVKRRMGIRASRRSARFDRDHLSCSVLFLGLGRRPK